jgi:Ran GTPase-activating protein (RanGAP) involved in mRNA processing and transport
MEKLELGAAVERLGRNDSTLTAADLSELRMGAEDLGELATALRGNTHLRRLFLHRNMLADLTALCDVLASEEGPPLAELHLSRNRLDDASCEALARLLAAPRQRAGTGAALVHLDLSRNEISDAGVKALAEGLRGNAHLADLSLRDNRIGLFGASALASALGDKGSGLRRLDMGVNEIGDEGTASLSTLLASPGCGLTFLSLDLNNITAVGATALASALARNSALERLSITDNHIRDEGAAALTQVLESNSTLQEVSMRGNKTVLAHTSV